MWSAAPFFHCPELGDTVGGMGLDPLTRISKFPWRSLEGLCFSHINLLTNCFTVTINYMNTNSSITKKGNFVITKGRPIGGRCSGKSPMWDNQ